VVNRESSATAGSCRELPVFRLEIQVMDWGQQALGSVQLALDESRVQDQFCLGVGELRLLPGFDLALHRLKVSLNAATPTARVSIRLKLLLYLARTGVNVPETISLN
jgi:hypothetical protein